MIYFTVNGRPCFDPAVALATLHAQQKPIPPAFANTSTLMVPLGRASARAWLLMKRSDLLAVGVDNTLSLAIEDGETIRVFGGMVVAKEPLALTPSIHADDDESLLLVELADARYRIHNPYRHIDCTKQYNCRAPAYGGAGSGTSLYYASSLDSGSTWTWSTMAADLWALVATQLGTFPGLPFTPDGTPEDFKWVGGSAWFAICDVLERIGCGVAWNGKNYTIVRIGEPDAVADALLASLSPVRIHDGEYVTLTFTREPATIRVLFNRREQYAGTEETNTRTSSQWQTLAPYAVDVAGGLGEGIHPLWDDLVAIYDAAGSLVNTAALASRAAERAADHFRLLRAGGSRFHRVFSGLQAFNPGSTLKGVTFRQGMDRSLVTEVVRHPYFYLQPSDTAEWQDVRPLNVSNQAPFFGPQWPTYPITDQILRINDGTPSGGLYDCRLLKGATSTTFATKDAIWGKDLAGATSLTAGDDYECRLFYYDAAGGGRPVYSFRSISGTITGDVIFKNDAVTFDSTTFTWLNDSIFGFPPSIDPAVPPAGRLVIPVLPSKPTYVGLNGEFVTDCNALYKYSTTLTAWNTYPKTINVIGSGTPKVPVYDPTSGGYDLSTPLTADTTNNRVGINTDAATTTSALTVTNNVTTDTGITVNQLSSATGDPLLINKAGDNTTPILQVTATGGTTVTPTATTTTGLQLNQPTSATADPLKITKPGDNTTSVLQVGPAGNIIVTPSSASQTAIAITTANNPSQPTLSITATGTPTADLFSVTNGSAVKVLAITDDYTLQFPTTSSTSTAPAANLSLPTLTVTGTPSWTPAVGEYPIEWNATDKTLWVWDGSTWDNVSGSGGSPGGSQYDIQANDGSGGFHGDSNAILDYANQQLAIVGDGTHTTVDVSDGTYDVQLCNQTNPAAMAVTDGLNTALVCDGTYAFNAATGSVNSQAAYHIAGTAGVTGSSLESDTATGGLWATIGVSDGRFKRDQQPIGPVLARLLQLHPVRFFWDTDLCNCIPGIAHDDQPQLGLLAEEIALLFPEAGQTGILASGIEVASYKATALRAILVAALQEEHALLTALAARVALLEGKK